MDFIRGEEREQIILLPDNIEDYVDEDNAVRVIDAYIDSLDLSALGFSNSKPNGTGRPEYDPKDLLKLYVYGYMNRVRSSRRLERESGRNLEVIWLMKKLRPDHKTIARFRHENSGHLKKVFKHFVRLCVELGLYGRELVAIDGSKFKAVNSTARNFTEGRIQKWLAKISEQTDKYLAELDRCDKEENGVGGEKSAKEIRGIVAELTKKKERYQGYADELERTGERQKSLTDADSRLMAGNGKTGVCYNVQTVADAKNRLIVDFEVTNRGNDKNCISPMAAKAQEMLEAENIAAVTDGGYESVQDITEAMGHGVEVHVAGTDFDVCVPAGAEEEASEITGHHNGRCVYIKERNIVLCPMGNVLYPASHRKHRQKGGLGVFHNSQACKVCACKCHKNKRNRFQYGVPMSASDFTKTYNDEGLTVKQIHIKPDKEIIKQRKAIIEHMFGTVKQAMDAGYCLTKGLKNVTGEFSLAYLAYNIKRVINIMGTGKLLLNMAKSGRMGLLPSLTVSIIPEFMPFRTGLPCLYNDF